MLRRSAALALVAALMVSIGAQCLVGHEMMTTAQMLCCAGTDHDCGGAAVAQDCCQSEQAEQDQLVSHIQQLVSRPALAPISIAAFVPPLDTYSPGFNQGTTELHAASPPKYVLLASFLI